MKTRPTFRIALVLGLGLNCQANAVPPSSSPLSDNNIGDRKTAKIEKMLFDQMGLYQLGFCPSIKLLADPVDDDEIPKEYLDEVKRVAVRSIAGSDDAERISNAHWTGFRRLKLWKNLLVTELTLVKGEQLQVTVADGYYLCLKFTLKDPLVSPPEKLTSGDIIPIILQRLKIAEEEKRKYTADVSVMSVDGATVAFGSLRCGWTPDKKLPAAEKNWWYLIPYWVTKDTLFIGINFTEKPNFDPKLRTAPALRTGLGANENK